MKTSETKQSRSILTRLLTAALLGALTLTSGCTKQDACGTADATSVNMLMLARQLDNAVANPIDFHLRVCPWLKSSERPYVDAMSRYAKHLQDRLNPNLCVLVGVDCTQLRAYFSAQGVWEEMEELSKSLEAACGTINPISFGYSIERAVNDVGSLTQYYGTLREYGGCPVKGAPIEVVLEQVLASARKKTDASLKIAADAAKGPVPGAPQDSGTMPVAAAPTTQPAR